MNFCPKCGNSVTPGSKFCESCGNQLVDNVPKQSYSDKLLLGLCVPAFFLLLVVIIIMCNWRSSIDPDLVNVMFVISIIAYLIGLVLTIIGMIKCAKAKVFIVLLVLYIVAFIFLVSIAVMILAFGLACQLCISL